MSNPPQNPTSVDVPQQQQSRDLGAINEVWQRRLLGRRFVKDVDEGFVDMKVSGFFWFLSGWRWRWKCGGLDLKIWGVGDSVLSD